MDTLTFPYTLHANAGSENTPAQGAEVELNESNLTLTLDDGRTVWIELDDTGLRVHVYVAPDHAEFPVSLTIKDNTITVEAQDFNEDEDTDLSVSI